MSSKQDRDNLFKATKPWATPSLGAFSFLLPNPRHCSDGVNVRCVFEANSRALCKKSCTLVEKSSALSERSHTRCAGIFGGSGQLTAEGGVFVAQAPSKSIKLADTALRFTMRSVPFLPGCDERLACDGFFVTVFLLQNLGAGGVILSQLGDVSSIERRGNLIAAQKAGDGSESHGTNL